MLLNRIKFRIKDSSFYSIARISYFFISKKGKSARLLRCVLRVFKMYPFRCVSLAEYAQSKAGCWSLIVENNRTGFYSNLVFNGDEGKYNLYEKPIPSLIMALLHNVNIIPASDFILCLEEDVTINDFGILFDGTLYRNADSSIYYQYNDIALMKQDYRVASRNIERGIMLTGRFSFNYYHTLFEHYIKLLIPQIQKIPVDVPLIVDESFLKYSSFRAICSQLNTFNRPVIVQKGNEILHVQDLYVFNHINIIPPEAFNVFSIPSSDVLFDTKYLGALRTELLKIRSKKIFPKRIYISRKNCTRRNFNEDEVYNMLQEYNFEKYAPEELSFEEQVSLFHGAEIIVGGSGAALSNVLFCQPRCKLLCFYSAKVNIPIFTTIAYSFGVKIRYFIGDEEEGSYVNNTHSDFLVNVLDLRKLLSEYIAE